MNEEHVTTLLLRDGVVLLGTALVLVILFRRLGLGAVLGYLVAGALIGPQGLGLVGDAEGKLGIAELGIVLLLFLVGLDLHPSRLFRLRRDIFGFGLAQVVLCGVALSAFLFASTGFSMAAAIALGLPLALSSTAQVLPMLRSAGRLSTPFGEKAFSILLFQDLSIVPLITIIAALSRAPADPSAPPGWLLAVYTVGAIIGLVLFGRLILNPLFRLIGGLGERELFIAAGLFTVMTAAAVMEALHLSTALGAFIAGMMLADSPYRHELEADIEPFRTILLGLFFLAVGMLLDLNAVAMRPVFVLSLAAAVVAIKTGVIFVLARLFGLASRQAFALGLLLSQGGEFGFVLFAQAKAAQLIAPEAASLFGAVVTLSMATTPFLMMLSRRFVNKKAADRGDLEGPHAGAEGSAIVVGYGRFGQTVAQMLMAKAVDVTLIDNAAATIDRGQDFGMKVYYGDGRRLDLLRLAGAETARAIIFCIDDRTLSRDELKTVMSAFPHAAILVRAYDRRSLMSLSGLDLAASVREMFESAVLMGRHALEAVGIPAEEIDRVEDEYRERDAIRLELQSQSGDLRTAKNMMFRPGNPMEEIKEG
ncbi:MULTISPECIES: cation:proton antiporter domain-containing protein [Edaphosphingomonas]|uniref:Sodium:proton exchanger n=2 Tax=Edaphosphingomonas TaxID=3423724 RepID=A0A2T4HU90_9SPHN|nr:MULTISPECIES: cation:proton antiporter [Sphingomonas]OHT20466.1 Glutathione-regulated potassium-efflux system protein KefC [Sphingomonas haloaromaticamans]PTD19337.1 sodium:proton exchanger [Sphingomonas fennica]